MSPIYLRNEAILTSGNAIATSENCCCDEDDCINLPYNCEVRVDINGSQQFGFYATVPEPILVDCSDVGGHHCNCVKYTFSELCFSQQGVNQFEKTIYGTVVENNGSFSIESQFTILNIQDENLPCPEADSTSLDFIGVFCN